MAKLAYYASRISPDKPHQFETPEGYRIYKDVPICRTGFQDYLGKELKSHPSYDPEWGLDDDEIVPVYRPKEEVTSPETIASFEAKSVVDGHPPDDVALVHADNEAEYGKGHAQNVRVGEPLADGETPLLADLIVKHSGLNDKIDAGVRDVSCGYVYTLKKAEDGTLLMTTIRGNHIAVLRKGRAGPDVSIGDAAPPETKQKGKVMNIFDHIFGRGLKDYAKDATPEELAQAMKTVGAAKDAEPADKEKDKVNFDVDFYWDSANQKAVPIRNSKGYSRRKAGDAADADTPDDKKEDEKKDDELEQVKDADPDEEKKEEEKEEEASTGDADVLELEGEEKGKSVLGPGGAKDAAAFLKKIKPVIAASMDKSIRDAYNAQVRALNGQISHGDSGYRAFAKPSASARDSAAVPAVDPTSFFNGKTYAEGMKAYQEYLKENK